MAIGDPQRELQSFNESPGPAHAGGDHASPKPPEADQLRLRNEKWSDEVAKGIVINDFQRAQAHRSKNFELRWDENERLYHANVPQRVWDGTDTPRSSIGVKLIWKQVWSMMPKIRQSIFESSDGIFFDVFPEPGTRAEQAIACRELQASQLNESGFSTYFDVSSVEGVIQGVGVLKLSWLRSQKEKLMWEDRLIPKLANVGGYQVMVGMERQFRQTKTKQVVNQPKVYSVPLRDFYVDPSHKLPWVNPPDDIPDGTAPRYVVHRTFRTLEDVIDLAQDKSYAIPGKDELIARAKKKLGPPKEHADTHKQMASLEAGVFQGYPTIGSTDPAKYPFEILEYWTEDRLVTMLDREVVIRNVPNPYGFIPFFALIPWPNPNEFYGKGLCEILEGEQRIQAGLINARLDEAALNIHGQLVYQEGMVIGKHQLRPRPGGAIGVTGPVDQAIKRLERQETMQSAFAEVGQSDMRAEQYTGITGIAVQGAPSSPTSATRTKFGIGVMAGATFTRLEYLIDKMADAVIVPLLNKMWQLNTRFLDPSQPLAILGPSLGKEIYIDPMFVANGEFRFEMRAASRLAAKHAMQQSLPFILQTLMNPGFIESLAEQGVLVNTKSVVRDTLDVMGWRNRNDWFTNMTPQQMQQRQQMQMQGEQMKMQREQMKAQSKQQLQGQQQGAELLKMLAEKSFDQAPGSAPLALAAAIQELNAGS